MSRQGLKKSFKIITVTPDCARHKVCLNSRRNGLKKATGGTYGKRCGKKRVCTS